MKFPIWLLPIFAMTIIITLTSSQQKPWRERSPEEREKRIILILVAIIFLLAGVMVFFL